MEPLFNPYLLYLNLVLTAIAVAAWRVGSWRTLNQLRARIEDVDDRAGRALAHSEEAKQRSDSAYKASSQVRGSLGKLQRVVKQMQALPEPAEVVDDGGSGKIDSDALLLQMLQAGMSPTIPVPGQQQAVQNGTAMDAQSIIRLAGGPRVQE